MVGDNRKVSLRVVKVGTDRLTLPGNKFKEGDAVVVIKSYRDGKPIVKIRRIDIEDDEEVIHAGVVKKYNVHVLYSRQMIKKLSKIGIKPKSFIAYIDGEDDNEVIISQVKF